MDVNNVEKIKNKIQSLFADREGFNDDVINAITQTYIYLKKNYDYQVDNSELIDVDDFSQNSSDPTKRSVANIYINRLLNNVYSIEFTENMSVYNYDSKKVSVETDLTDRMKQWESNKIKETVSEEERKIIEDKMRAKLIVHELLHAASDNGAIQGFSVVNTPEARAKRTEMTAKDPIKYKNKEAYSYQLEEAITEILALNIVGCDNLSMMKNKDGFNFCRNPESSNCNLNAFAEYFLRVYPDCVRGKFVDGLAWNNQFEQEHLVNWGLTAGASGLIPVFEHYLNEITSRTPTINQINTLAYFQQAMLTEYLNDLQVNNEQELNEVIKNFVAFRIFAVKDMQGKVDEDLSELITSLRSFISEKANELGMDKEEVKRLHVEEHNKIISRDDQEEVIRKPYERTRDAVVEQSIAPNKPTMIS